MIIGNNNNNQSFTKLLGNHFENGQFKNQNNTFQQNMKNNQKNIFTKDIKTNQHINPVNKNDMADKTLALLHERLEKGSISLDEFTRQCELLGKRRNN